MAGIRTVNRQRHSQTVIDFEFAAYCDVEAVVDQFFDQVFAEFRGAENWRDRTSTPPFVGYWILFGGTDRKCRYDVEIDGIGMVVVHHYGDVRGVVRHPFPGWCVAVEQRLPVRIRGLVVVHCGADGGNVRGCERPDDVSQSSVLPRALRQQTLPTSSR